MVPVQLDDGKFSLNASSNALSVRASSKRDSGRFMCLARNGFRPELAQFAQLTVLEPPSFAPRNKQLVVHEARVKQSASIECRPTSGELPITLQWLDAQSLKPLQLATAGNSSSRFSVRVLSATNDSQEMPAKALQIDRLEMTDSAQFVCDAQNKYGADQLLVQLVVQDKPNKLASLGASSLSNGSVLIRWQPSFDGNAPLSGHLVQYAFDEFPVAQLTANDTQANEAVASVEEELTPTDKKLVELSVNSTEPQAELKSLNAFCAYRVRVAAINKVGLGEFSDWLQLTTDETPPSAAPHNISAFATGPNSVKLSWLVPELGAWNGQLVAFRIGFRPVDSMSEHNKTIDWTPHKSVLPQLSFRGAARLGQVRALLREPIVAHLTNLQRSTTYLCWLQAINSRGVSPQSYVVPVRTLDDVPPSAPSLRVHSASTHSLTLVWSLASNFVSPANQYSIFYRRVRNSDPAASPFAQSGEQFVERTVGSEQLLFGSNNPLNADPLAGNSLRQHPSSVNGQSHQFVHTLDNLDCGSEFELYMTTRNSVGKSEPSSVVSSRTLGEVPRAPSSADAFFARIAVNEVLLNLNAWHSSGCAISAMTFRFAQTSNVVFSAAVGASSISSTLSQLPSATVSVPSGLLNALATHQLQAQVDNNFELANGNKHLPVGLSSFELFPLKGLLPATTYAMQVSATSSAGTSVANFEFATAGVNNSRPGFAIGETEKAQQRSSHLSSRMLSEFASGGDLKSVLVGADSSLSDAFSQIYPLLMLVVCCVFAFLLSAFCCSKLNENYFSSGTALGNDRKSQQRSLAGRLLASQRSLNGNSSRTDFASNHAATEQSDVCRSYKAYKASPWKTVKQCADFDRRSPSMQQLHDPSGQQFVVSNGATGFAQSVSMRDFNDLTQPQTTMNRKLNIESINVRQHQQQSQLHQNHAATLNLSAINKARNATRNINFALDADSAGKSHTLRLTTHLNSDMPNQATTSRHCDAFNTYDDAMFTAAKQLYSFDNANNQAMADNQIYSGIKSAPNNFVVDNQALEQTTPTFSEVVAAAIAQQQQHEQQTSFTNNTNASASFADQRPKDYFNQSLDHQLTRLAHENYAIPNQSSAIEEYPDFYQTNESFLKQVDSRECPCNTNCSDLEQYSSAVQQILSSTKVGASLITPTDNLYNSASQNCNNQLYAAINGNNYAHRAHNRSSVNSNPAIQSAIDSSSSSSGIDVSQHIDNSSLINGYLSTSNKSSHQDHNSSPSVHDNSSLTQISANN